MPPAVTVAFAVKSNPVMTMSISTAPAVNDGSLITGPVEGTMNGTPLVATPRAVTTTLPEIAPVEAAAVIDVLLQLVIVAGAVTPRKPPRALQ